MKLYIVGNGFDLNHGRKTSYWDYRNYLSEKYPDLVYKFDMMEYTKGAEVDVNSRWSDLENKLWLDYDSAFSEITDNYYPDLDSERTPGWDDIGIEVNNRYGFFKKFTRDCFYEWICDEDQEFIDNNFKRHVFYSDSYFVTVNYTKTLENLYSIPADHILHIHGAVDFPDSIQFGTPENNPIIAQNDLEKQFRQDEFYGVAVEPGVSSLVSCMNHMYKDIAGNMGRLETFVGSICGIDEIIIMGHSFSGIDAPYYSQKFIPKFYNVNWTIYVHNDRDMNEAQQFARYYNICDRCKFIPW